MPITTLKVLASVLQLHGPGATLQSDHQGIDALLNNMRDQSSADAIIPNDGKADAISFGRPFISNPDLTKRFAKGLALTPDDKATWYTGGATGYADYPAAE